MRYRDYLKKQAIRTGSPNLHQAYKPARNYTNKLIKKIQTSYYRESFEKTSKNPKAMWNTINKLLNKKSKTTTVTQLTSRRLQIIVTVTDKQEIANNFNEYFSNIGAKLADKNCRNSKTSRKL